MRPLEHTFYYPSRSDTFTLWPIGDVHIGHAACNEAAFMADVERIRTDQNAYWIGIGDYIDAISRKGDKRYVETSLAPFLRDGPDPIGRQARRFISLVEPIAHKCLGLGIGNHEAAVLDHADRDVYLEIVRGIADAADRRIRDLAYGWETFITLKFRRGTADSYGGTRRIVVYTHHGSGGGRKQGGHALRMEEVLLTYECDLALLGHRHIRQVVNKTSVAPKGRGITYKERIGVWCGSYLEAYIDDMPDDYPVGNYPQKIHLAPTTIGTVPVLIKPDIPSVMPIITNGKTGMLLDAIRSQEAEEAA